MKRVMMLVMLFIGASTTMVNAQQTSARKGLAKEVKKEGKMEKKEIKKSKLPKVVTETFITEFPVIEGERWFGYPSFDYSTDWYDYDPYLYEVENPEFYVVEFKKGNVHHKAVYSKEGKKIAVHKKTKEELPKAILAALKKSKFATWKIANEKEVIYRDSEMDKIKTYKVVVEKGTEKHIIYYSNDGDMLKDKKSK